MQNKIQKNKIKEQSNGTIKSMLLDQLNQLVWSDDILCLALHTKKHSRLQKSKNVDCHYIVLKEDQLTNFLEKLKKYNCESTKKRFQAAVHHDNHWYMLDIEIKHNQLSCVYIDSIRNTDQPEKIQQLIEQFYGKNYFFYDIYLNALSLQRDYNNCSRFTLNNIFTCQKAISLHDELAWQKKENQNNFLISFKTMPISLLNILRPLQDINFIKYIPESILKAPIKAPKEYDDNSKQTFTLEKLYEQNIKPHENDLGLKIWNMFILDKREKYTKKISTFINQTSESELNDIITNARENIFFELSMNK
ncbi:MAG: hypothetical protein HYX60_05795 [Legionella longbeachae]|nr:hypothetical protein [Legionella longbeachae]